MAEMHHKPREKVDVCNISGCKNQAVRSIPVQKAREVLSEVNVSGKRAHLCKQHYKEFRKKTRKDRELETLNWK